MVQNQDHGTVITSDNSDTLSHNSSHFCATPITILHGKHMANCNAVDATQKQMLVPVGSGSR